tara:strand:+ start:156 stop:641 length:486 start_codon:yes stop_codon:yes gene_type:complete
MKKIITGIGLLLLVTGCVKESTQPECDILINNNVSIFSISGADQVTGEWKYVGYYDTDSNITAHDKFMSSYTLYLDECEDIYHDDCATNSDYWYLWNWNMCDQGNPCQTWMAQPDIEIYSQQQYIQDQWNISLSPIGQQGFYLIPHDLTISINNGDVIIFH